MNTVVTSRDAILAVSRKLAAGNGLSSLNIRAVASACGVAVGSIYNYFPSKDALVSAVVEDIWRDIFHLSASPIPVGRFADCIGWMFTSIQHGCQTYPGFFSLHSISFAASEKANERQKMEHFFGHIKTSLLEVLHNDTQVKENCFDEALTEETFVDMVFTLLISRLIEGEKSCAPLLRLIENYLYEPLN